MGEVIKMSRKYKVTKEEQSKIDLWLEKEVYPEAIEKQKADTINPSAFHMFNWDAGYPYQGPIGGGVTYCFTPTSLGVIFKVKETMTGKELDLTDYDLW